MLWRSPSRPRCSSVVLVATAELDGRRPATRRRCVCALTFALSPEASGGSRLRRSVFSTGLG
jgi:hypothetical protein